MTTPLIEVRRFSFRLGGKEILRNVSFEVRKGEYLAVVGPNGAGKTTLLKCLMRILSGGSGEIAIDGRPLAAYGQRQLAERLSYVPQAGDGGSGFTVEQFVLMGRYPYLSPFKTTSRADRAAVADALRQAGTLELAGRLLETLSGGERQAVYVAAALAQQTDVMLLDEPTAFLDYRHQADIRALLRRLNRRGGVTVVAVTHDLSAAALDADRVMALRQGEVAFCGPPAEVMRPDVLARIYDWPAVLVAHPQARLPVIVPAAPETMP
jgi:ABC-type cobalamin/Fe3+-siderophores transport system ATPase subunit